MELDWATLEYIPSHLHFFHRLKGRRVGGHWMLLCPLPGHLVTTQVEVVSLVLPRGGRPPGKAGPENCGDLPPDEHATSLNLSPSFP